MGRCTHFWYWINQNWWNFFWNVWANCIQIIITIAKYQKTWEQLNFPLFGVQKLISKNWMWKNPKWLRKNFGELGRGFFFSFFFSRNTGKRRHLLLVVENWLHEAWKSLDSTGFFLSQATKFRLPIQLKLHVFAIKKSHKVHNILFERYVNSMIGIGLTENFLFLQNIFKRFFNCARHWVCFVKFWKKRWVRINYQILLLSSKIKMHNQHYQG